MKKIYVLMFVIATLLSCSKEDNVNMQDTKTSSLAEKEYQFTQEIEVTDMSNENSVYLAIHSDDEVLLKSFLNNFNLNLIISSQKSAISETNISDLAPVGVELDKENYNLDEEPKILIELITENIKSEVIDFSINFENKGLKSTNDFIFGYPVGYFTKNDFIGAFHHGDGYIFVAKIRYKSKWYTSWNDYVANGANAWYVNSYSNIYFGSSAYERGLIIYPHNYQKGINYRIAYSKDEFRGSDCSIGNYDGRNCFVKAAPSGTQAFLYPSNTGYLYYTKASGSNPCPAGGYFDGANCQVAKIPAGTSGFIYNNSLYVLPDKILN